MTQTEKKTLVTMLLDRSGSMQSAKCDTIGAINAYLETLQKAEGDLRFSLVQFDARHGGMRLERTCVAKRIAEVEPLTDADYLPQGTTPLIDAACTTIHAVQDALDAKGYTPESIKVVLVLQTDGAENASVENSWSDLKSLIMEKEKAGWEIIFMGADIDAYEQGSRMGIARSKTVSYGKSAENTRAVFAAAAENTVALSVGSASDLRFSRRQKVSAGDGSNIFEDGQAGDPSASPARPDPKPRASRPFFDRKPSSTRPDRPALKRPGDLILGWEDEDMPEPERKSHRESLASAFEEGL